VNSETLTPAFSSLEHHPVEVKPDGMTLRLSHNIKPQ
jgi:hypothetical protein